MAATDQHYRNQYALDVVFAVSSALMLASLVGMIIQDYNKPFKEEQRRFRDVESAMAQRMALEQLPNEEEFDIAKTAVEKARVTRSKRDEAVAALKGKIGELLPGRASEEQAFQAVKSDLESKVSFYNIEVEDHGADTSLAKQYLQDMDDLQAKLGQAKLKRDDIVLKVRELQEQVDAIEKPLTDALANLKKVNDRFDTQVAVSISKQWRTGDWVRALPILDAFASPIKIHQFTLNDVPIDYNFKYVTRFDRCMTCHQGIDRPAYTRENLEALRTTTDAQESNLTFARGLLQDRKNELKGLPDAAQVPDPVKLKLNIVPKDHLTDARITEYCAHPRLDLFVGSNSKHPAEKFGCSSCHSGQGSATDFVNAAHTPNNGATKAKWEKEQGWESQHYWDFPMNPQRFVESACLKCHHQVTDLISSGNRNEAPKLLRGFSLIRENGCFGCHEIAGRKGGRPIGPDLRLEPYPPLEDLTPAEQTKILADVDNPPGTYRKVGPSLFRLSEKTNKDWTVRWLAAPRQFRPDTKMPHFYNTSNNDPKALAGSGQEDFPATEMHAIAHYLFESSDTYLAEVEAYKKASAAQRQQDLELQAFLQSFVETKAALTTDRLAALTKMLPAKFGEGKKTWEKRSTLTAKELAAWSGQLKTFNGILPPDQNKDVTRALEFELKEVSRRIRLRDHVPLLTDLAKGHTPNPGRGRQLFSERGCLACHVHQGTETKQGKAGDKDFAPAVTSEALFGPNLSQIKDKLGSKSGDRASAQKWLVQWLMDPTIHSPRTRMPVTFLTPDQAADIAGWLLDQPAQDLGPDWKTTNPEKPTVEKLQKLASVYLTRLMPKDQLKILWEKGTKDLQPGVADDLGVEERQLLTNLTEEGLLHYLGKKAVGRLGCYACHDVPGFENAKPIGTGLNEWGKKDPDRLAFENIQNFVTDHFNIVESLEVKGKPVEAKKVGDKVLPAYEKFYADSLFHHGRPGYLNQKLLDPRSYDYQRKLAWDDRGRMPQFRFARLQQKKGESVESFEARANLEEAKARESVATFVLGLTAEQVPLISINQPAGDRAAEVKGRAILDKFNCAGCHLVQPGVVDFKLTDKLHDALEKKAVPKKDMHYFPEHYHFTGKDPVLNDRLLAHVANPKLMVDEDDPNLKTVVFNLAEALRFQGKDRTLKDLPFYTYLELDPKNMIFPPTKVWESPEALKAFLAGQGPYGGAFADLLTGYLVAKDAKSATVFYTPDVARAAAPPILLGQGERTQPEWLYQFLLNPQPVRKMSVLRMPRFNMSKEEARGLVDYFSALERINNPGIGLTAPYETIKQQDASGSYWVMKTQDYVARLKAKDPKGGKTWYDKRMEELEPLWKQVEQDQKGRLDEAKKQLAAAEKRVKDAKNDDEKAEAERVLAAWKGESDLLARDSTQMGVAQQKKTWEERDAYLVDSYRLLFNRDLCAKCHQLGPQENTNPLQGPPLTLAHKRLRPGWLQRWIAGPQLFLTYGSSMPNNFPADQAGKYQNLFVGSSLEQIRAARDVLMNYQHAEALPVNRLWFLPAVNQPKDDPAKKETPAKKDASSK